MGVGDERATASGPCLFATGRSVSGHTDSVKAAYVKRAGMTPARAIQSGTIVNAEAMGWSDRVGSVEVGKFG